MLKIFSQLTHFLPYRALSLLKTLPPSTLDSPDVTKKILGDRPNTYTFTKVKRALGYEDEFLITRHRGPFS